MPYRTPSVPWKQVVDGIYIDEEYTLNNETGSVVCRTISVENGQVKYYAVKYEGELLRWKVPTSLSVDSFKSMYRK